MNHKVRFLILGILFFTLTFYLYWPARNAGMVTDFIGTLERLQGANLRDVLLNTFGFYGFQQINYLFLYTFLNLFGIEHPFSWHLVYVFTHVVNGLLVFKLFEVLFKRFDLKYNFSLALIIALLWLTSPYHTEAVVWQVCYSYLICTAMILGTLIFIERWIADSNNRYLFLSHLLFLIALFTFEYSFVTPGLTVLMLYFCFPGEKVFDRKTLGYLLLPQLSLLFFRFVMSRIIFDSWTAHYGDDVHLNLSLQGWLGNNFRYFSKYLLYTRYLSGKYENAIMGFFGNPIYLSGLSVLFSGWLLYLVFNLQKVGNKAVILGFFLLSFVAALFPIHNLYIVTLMYIEGDRLAYLASIFFYGFVMIILAYLPRYIWLVLGFTWILGNAYYLRWTNTLWQGSAEVSQSLLDHFIPGKEEELILLNVPDNFRGAPMFRNITGSQLAFTEAYRRMKQQPILHENIYEVAQYNMATVRDGVSVSLDSTDRLKVNFNQYGNWWWRLRVGATNYENERYKFINQGQHYLLQFKHPIGDSRILFQDGGQWKVFKLPSEKILE